MTIAVSSAHSHSIPSLRVLLAAFIVTFGFFIGVAPDAAITQGLREAPSQLSIFYGVLSSLFIAVHAVLIKISLPYAGNSTIQLAYWQNLGSAIFLAPFILFQGEFTELFQLYHNPDWNAKVFVWGSLVTGVFGFLLCVAGLLSIKVTSPVTHMFSSVSLSLLRICSMRALANLSVPIPALVPLSCCGMCPSLDNYSRPRAQPFKHFSASGCSTTSYRRKWCFADPSHPFILRTSFRTSIPPNTALRISFHLYLGIITIPIALPHATTLLPFPDSLPFRYRTASSLD